MPLRYELAFGGPERNDQEPASSWDARNPIGRGYLLSERSAPGSYLPNFEDPNQTIQSWRDKPPVSGFGFIGRSWQPRAQLAGTYDSAWQKHHFPLLPADFDRRFFNCAAPGLIAPGYLTGDEPVELINLSRREFIQFRLPKFMLRISFRLGSELYIRPTALWTLVFEPDQDRFYMVFGASIPVGKQPSRLRYAKIEYEEGMPTWN
jgi:hypothetical protein